MGGIVTKKILKQGVELVLTAQRVIYIPSIDALVLSDMHVGKSGHFQKYGIPIAKNVLLNDLRRLQDCIEHFSPKKVIVVGDLFHANYNSDLETFRQWLQHFSTLEFVLVRGNHDRLPNSLYQKLNLIVFNERWQLRDLEFVHDTENHQFEEQKITFSGHVHPGVFLKGKGRQRIKLPCFVETNHEIILPAFSEFTGLNTKFERENAKYFAFTKDRIIEL